MYPKGILHLWNLCIDFLWKFYDLKLNKLGLSCAKLRASLDLCLLWFNLTWFEFSNIAYALLFCSFCKVWYSRLGLVGLALKACFGLNQFCAKNLNRNICLEKNILVQNNSSQKEMRKKIPNKFWFKAFWSKNIFVTEKFGPNDHEK